ncbi:MAG: hypothetical protein CBC36_04935 [Verrucomicrobiaceae bacterium TMED76]|nr:MAG: hypothetical protein CBC36_04935 [Verrucomicrobiaceae bacterium TMED76]
MTILEHLCIEKFASQTFDSLSLSFSNFLSEKIYPSELERVFYPTDIENQIAQPRSSDFIPARSKDFLEKKYTSASKEDLNLITDFENWYQDKLKNIDELEDKLKDPKKSSSHLNTISVVLSQIKQSIGISD